MEKQVKQEWTKTKESGKLGAFGAGLEITRLYYEARTDEQIAKARHYATQAMDRARAAGLTEKQIRQGVREGREAFFRSHESPTQRANRA